VAQDLEIIKRDVFSALDVGFQQVASRLLLGTRGAGPRDWRLLGRCLGRVKRDLERYLDSIDDPELLELIAGTLIFEPLLETQVKASYLFAQKHGYRQPAQDELDAQIELLQGSSVASALARREREREEDA